MAGQYPHYAPFNPGPLGPPVPPPAMRRATTVMRAGATLAIAGGVVNALVTHHDVAYSYSSTPSGPAVHSSFLVGGIIGGLVDAALWAWMAWKTGAGRGWARVLSTVFFGLGSLGLLLTVAGAAAHGGSALLIGVAVTLVAWSMGLTAVILLWRPESSAFFTAADQARARGRLCHA